MREVRRAIPTALLSALVALMLGAAAPAFAQVDAEAAQALAKKSNCLKCHSVSAKKEGPPFKETAHTGCSSFQECWVSSTQAPVREMRSPTAGWGRWPP